MWIYLGIDVTATNDFVLEVDVFHPGLMVAEA
jgi:hypothetical protein